ncbi:MAG TPA: riboflavin biosynthesis protein RibF [Gemmataceae bacterium]|jgi:riboflavin kinase/FMN adenylyltransferase
MAIHEIPWQAAFPASCRHGAVTIGNFDGVHRGHAALLGKLKDAAKDVKGPAVALTFQPHPVCLLHPELCPPALTTLTDRIERLHAGGADHVLLLRIDLDMLHLTARDFFERIIRTKLDPRILVEGVNFGFGRNREGNIDTLEQLCGQAGIGFQSVPPLVVDGQAVSSSRVRHALLEGAVADAAHLLGRPYRLRGHVGTGQRRGKTIGFPTANLERMETLIPGNGVYAVRAEHREKVWPGAANIGPNPTFGENDRKVEAHLIGFQGDLYGETLAVDFLERLRDTRPFAGAAELAAQLGLDVEQARHIAGSMK